MLEKSGFQAGHSGLPSRQWIIWIDSGRVVKVRQKAAITIGWVKKFQLNQAIFQLSKNPLF